MSSTLPPNAPPAASELDYRLRLRRTGLCAAVLALAGLHIALNGYSFGGYTERRPGTSPSSDHANVLPWVYWYAGPSLFPRDFMIQWGVRYRTVLWPLVAAISPMDHIEWTFFVLHVLSLAATFAMVIAWVRQWSGSDQAALLACLFMMVIRVSPAGEPTYDAAFYTRGVALPLALAALLFLLRGQGVRGFLLLLITIAIHSLTAFHAAALAVPAWILAPRVTQRKRWGLLAVFIVCAIVVARIMTGHGGTQLGPPSAGWLAIQHATNAGHVFVREWTEGVWREFAVCVLLLLPPVLAPSNLSQRRAALAAVIGGAILIGLGWLTTGPLPSFLMMQLVPVRGLKLVMIVGLMLAAEWIVRLLREAGDNPVSGARLPAPAGGGARARRPAAGLATVLALCVLARQDYLATAAFVGVAALAPGWRFRGVPVIAGVGVLAWFISADVVSGAWRAMTWTSIAVAAGLAAVAVALLLAPPRPAMQYVVAFFVLACLASVPLRRDGLTTYAAWDFPFRHRANDWTDLQRWAAKNTPVDAHFLVPPWLEGFRTFSRRSLFVDLKTGGMSLFSGPFAREWSHRMARLTPRQFSADAYADIALNYDALSRDEFVSVVQQYGITHVVVRTPRPDLPWPQVFANRTYRVLDTRTTRG